MTLDEIEAEYRRAAGLFDEADRWVFRQDTSNWPSFLAARQGRMHSVLEEIRRLIERAAPLCEQWRQEHTDRRSIPPLLRTPPGTHARTKSLMPYNWPDEKLETAIIAEARIAACFADPAGQEQAEHAAKLLSVDAYFTAVNRIYRNLSWLQRVRPRASAGQATIAAVLRVRNEASNLRVLLPVLLGYFDEVVIADHNSSDGTFEFIESLRSPKIKLVRYKTDTAPAGEFYVGGRLEGLGSLADYYNFAFSHASSTYVCKWDADMYPLPLLEKLLSEVRASSFDVYKMNGLDCRGYASCYPEPRIFRRTAAFRYEDEFYCEILYFEESEVRLGNLEDPVYLHMKQYLPITC